MIFPMRTSWVSLGSLCGLLFSAMPLCADERPPQLRRFFASVRLGPTYEYTRRDTPQQPLIDARLAVGGEFGIALDEKRRLSLLLQGLAQLDPRFPGQTNGLILLGFQYHLPLGPPGLYLSPRVSLGYASASVLYSSGDYIDSYRGDFVALSPELALTYVLGNGITLMLTPLSFPTLMRADGRGFDYHAFYAGCFTVGWQWGSAPSSL